MRPIAVNGFHSNAEAIRVMTASGHTAREIAERTGCTPEYVRNVRRRARAAPAIWLEFKPETALKLAAHAMKRGIGLSALVRQIADAVARDDLVDAVLDDE